MEYSEDSNNASANASDGASSGGGFFGKFGGAFRWIKDTIAWGAEHYTQEIIDALDETVKKIAAQEKDVVKVDAGDPNVQELYQEVGDSTEQLSENHPYYKEITRVVQEHLGFSRIANSVWADSIPLQLQGDLNASSTSLPPPNEDVWQLFYEEGDGRIRMYRRELEIEGRIIDPLKSTAVVSGIHFIKLLIV